MLYNILLVSAIYKHDSAIGIPMASHSHSIPFLWFITEHQTWAPCQVKVAQWYLTLQPRGLEPARLLCPWDSPGKDIGVGSLSLIQGMLPTQVSNPGLPHCRRIISCLSHQQALCLLQWISTGYLILRMIMYMF